MPDLVNYAFYLVIILLLVVSCFSVRQLLKRNVSSNEQLNQLKSQLDQYELSQNSAFNDSKHHLEKSFLNHRESVTKLFHEHRTQIDQHQLENLKLLQESLQKSFSTLSQQSLATLSHHTESLTKQLDKLTETNEAKLKEIAGQVDKRLHEGFEKTTATFTDVVKRLALIDEAQKKITDLSNNVVSLQEILVDKRSRGAFGEVQLNSLIANVLPEAHYSLQHTLANGKRVDCLLFLPEPTGNVAIDAKFPLENFHRMTTVDIGEIERKSAEQAFRQDIKKHISDIAEKYIIPGETSDGAIMFIPAEAIFAEIHTHYPDLVDIAHKARVWITSPTTMMAILTTARAVIKDEATRQQVHIIQEHLQYLSKDFERFQARMDNLAKHVGQVHSDVGLIQTSAKKITSRFQKIEKVEVDVEEIEG